VLAPMLLQRAECSLFLAERSLDLAIDLHKDVFTSTGERVRRSSGQLR
jgi:hypothetical protein